MLFRSRLQPTQRNGARACILNLTGGSTREDVRLTDRAHGHRRLPPSRGDGKLTGGDIGHRRMRGWYRWTQGDVGIRVVVEMVAEAAWFTGNEVTRRRCFGRRWFRPFPAAKRVGKGGERVSDVARFQIERERGGGGLYRANADEPRRRSSSSISSPSGSGDKWVVGRLTRSVGE